ncbi:hypothetical protein EJ05DRAFT_176477 [Pseudovirgaria hyperparasitica]|uniref:Uncharacterized protein n=1 Tax=Pseudovirgaria hyperparasitica TaxID=470096 RepID=A0A6A6WFF8_9PEZI|nr:uncharacterized protein EJ05DRAFT_176477 [Pseudovirgaria hyperparasitica]KAF2761558.1 hypothetical protein EJ05DRAFT_176477 [Pseudovirgaria hyperparasitica]
MRLLHQSQVFSVIHMLILFRSSFGLLAPRVIPACRQINSRNIRQMAVILSITNFQDQSRKYEHWKTESQITSPELRFVTLLSSAPVARSMTSVIIGRGLVGGIGDVNAPYMPLQNFGHKTTVYWHNEVAAASQVIVVGLSCSVAQSSLCLRWAGKAEAYGETEFLMTLRIAPWPNVASSQVLGAVTKRYAPYRLC